MFSLNKWKLMFFDGSIIEVERFDLRVIVFISLEVIVF